MVVKNGPADTVHFSDNRITSFPVPPIDTIVDTTAAGDSFNGAYIAAVLQNQPTATAINFAQRCAGKVITEKGALIPFANLAL